MRAGLQLPRLGLRGAGLLVLGLLGVCAVWDIRHRCAEVSRSRRQQSACAAELRPLVSAAVEDVAAAITQSEQALDGARRDCGLLTVERAASAPEYFELSERLARWREQARVAGLRIKEGERFGFAVRGADLGEAESPGRLRRRLRAMDRMVESVLIARPEEVLSWQCVEPADGALAPCLAGGMVAGTTVRVVFSGDTDTLRGLLNTLSGAEPAWIVHSVDARRRHVAQGSPVVSMAREDDAASSLVMRAEAVSPREMLNGPNRRVFPVGVMHFEVTASFLEWTGQARPRPSIGAEWKSPWPAVEANAGALFTPPTLWFDDDVQRWARAQLEKQDPRPVILPVKVLGVMPEFFRLQLSGYIGDEHGGCGVFTNQETRESFLAGAEADVPGLGVRILKISRDRAHAKTTASVLDVRCGEELELSDQHWKETGTLIAALEVAGVYRRVRVDDDFSVGGVRYHVESIRDAPACVEITAESPAWPGRVVRTLKPPEPFTP